MQCMFPEIWSGTDRIYLFSTSFCCFTLLATQKIKILKKLKKHLEISSFYTKFPKNHDHMLYCSWDMARDGCNYYFSFWASFCPFIPLTTQKIKISKKGKKHLEISSFYTCIPKIMIRWSTVPKKWCATNERTDGWKKWHIEVGAPSKCKAL